MVEFVPGPTRIALTLEGRGPLVLFLHGIGGNRLHWQHQLAFFSQQGFRAAAWDARGYGDSDDYEGALQFDDFTADALNDPDNPPADDLIRRRGRPPLEHPKEAVKLRLDADVLEHFRSDGPGWQTRINDALRRAAGK